MNSTAPTVDPITIKAWTGLLRSHEKALASVEAALKSASLPPLAWYDVLLEVERSSTAGIRPYQLQRQLLLPQYAMSRLLERIENSGYLRRGSCDDDGRGQIITITPAGKKIREQMWPVYGPAIEHAITKNLSTTQCGQLAQLLGRLAK